MFMQMCLHGKLVVSTCVVDLWLSIFRFEEVGARAQASGDAPEQRQGPGDAGPREFAASTRGCLPVQQNVVLFIRYVLRARAAM